MHRACLIQYNANLIQANRTKNYKPKHELYIFPHIRKVFNSIFWFNMHSIHLFCAWFFIIDLFSNIQYSVECSIFPNILLNLQSRTQKVVHLYCVDIFCNKVRFYETFTFINSKTRILLIETLYKFRTIKCGSALYLQVSVLGYIYK